MTKIIVIIFWWTDAMQYPKNNPNILKNFMFHQNSMTGDWNRLYQTIYIKNVLFGTFSFRAELKSRL